MLLLLRHQQTKVGINWMLLPHIAAMKSLWSAPVCRAFRSPRQVTSGSVKDITYSVLGARVPMGSLIESDYLCEINNYGDSVYSHKRPNKNFSLYKLFVARVKIPTTICSFSYGFRHQKWQSTASACQRMLHRGTRSASWILETTVIRETPVVSGTKRRARIHFKIFWR